jgi:hypothetical protein
LLPPSQPERNTVKVVWSGAETAWALGLPYVRWLTLLSQSTITLLACLTVSQLMSVHENMANTHRAIRCAYSTTFSLLTCRRSFQVSSVKACQAWQSKIPACAMMMGRHKVMRCCRLLSSVTELLNSSPEAWIAPVLACILIQGVMVAATVPAATYAYAHSRAAQFGPVSWIPKEHPWAQHAVAGTFLVHL